MFNKTDYFDVSDAALSDLKEEIENFRYEPIAKKSPQQFFKCWNFHKQIKQWDWKVTNREGNHCYDFKYILEYLVEAQIEYTHQLAQKHKTKVRIAEENLAAIKKISLFLKKIP